MPQMMPLNWLGLYFYFFIIYIMILMINYFLFNKIFLKNNLKFKDKLFKKKC